MKEDNSNRNFNYSYVDMEEVASNIDEYIIPECQEACKMLWNKNIFTFMCSNRDDGDNKYIMVSSLSEENEALFKALMERYPSYYNYDGIFRHAYSINVHANPDRASELLKKLTTPFQMQDVQEGFQTVEDFLIDRFGICRTVEKDKSPQPQMEDFENPLEYLDALDEWAVSVGSGDEVVFDESKMTKSVEEYLQEAGVSDLYDADQKVVYKSKFYMDAHKKYLVQIKDTRMPNKENSDQSDPHDDR